MNKTLLWTGLVFQAMHFLGWAIFGFALIYHLITLRLLVGIAYLLFNVLTLLMIIIGALSE